MEEIDHNVFAVAYDLSEIQRTGNSEWPCKRDLTVTSTGK